MLKFKGKYIVNQDDKEVASLDDHFPVITSHERYTVYLNSWLDYLNPEQLQSYISDAKKMQAENIVQAGMKNSLVEQLKQKLHTCLMLTDVNYRQEFEISELKKQVEQLEKSLNEERKQRWKIENELFELKQSFHNQEEIETENENEN